MGTDGRCRLRPHRSKCTGRYCCDDRPPSRRLHGCKKQSVFAFAESLCASLLFLWPGQWARAKEAAGPPSGRRGGDCARGSKLGPWLLGSLHGWPIACRWRCAGDSDAYFHTSPRRGRRMELSTRITRSSRVVPPRDAGHPELVRSTSLVRAILSSARATSRGSTPSPRILQRSDLTISCVGAATLSDRLNGQQPKVRYLHGGI